MAESILEIYNQICIQQYKTDMGFKALVEGVQDNLFVVPEYQRKFRWSKEQTEELAASLIRDLPIPPIYTHRNENGQLEILDGQQRLMSLYLYYRGKFFRSPRNSVFDYSDLEIKQTQNFEEALIEKYPDIVPTKFYMKLDGKKYDISYDSLPVLLKRKIDYRTISVIEIKISENEKRNITLQKIFTNLNNGGTRLSNQELRNGIYPCAFSRMANKLNKENKKWRTLYGKIDDECRDIEFLYRFCAMKRFVVYENNEFKINEYKNSIRELMDSFAEQAFSFAEIEVEKYKKRLEHFIEILDISKQNFSKTLLIEGLFVVWEKTGINLSKITDEMCQKIQNDKKIQDTQQGGTVSIMNMNKRWKRIYEILSEYVE